MRIPRTVVMASGALVGTAMLIAGGLAFAANPPNTYTGCLKPDGGMINVKIGTAPLNPCKTSRGQKKISWNETGPQGPQGIEGQAGPQGPAGAPSVIQIVGDGTSGTDDLGTTSTSWVDVGPDFTATVDVEEGDWLEMHFEANTNRSGSNFIFHYFTFSIDGIDIDTGTGASANRGGIAAIYNVDRPDAAGWGTARVNMTYWWKAPSTGSVVVKPRHKSDGAGTGQVWVVNNGDINPVFAVVNHGHQVP